MDPDTPAPAPAPGTAPVAVVTGASAGVGRATARRFAAQGYDVGLLARGERGLREAAADVERCGRRARWIVVDVADADAVQRAADMIEAELGPVEVWVNNAMTTVFAPIDKISPAEFERATRVTYLGQVYGTMAALRSMRVRDRGVVVSVGSALAFRAIALQSPYCGAKFAVRGFHESVRTELRHDGSGVRVVQVHLPAVNTPQFGWCRNRMERHAMPVPPIYEPEVIARAIVEVARHPRRQRIIGTWNWGLIQLSKLVPGVLDHYAARATVDGQQTGEPVDPNAPGNLERPLDGPEGSDHGARGGFGSQASGVRSPSFLRSLPGLAADSVAAGVGRAREIAGDWAPGRQGRAEPRLPERPPYPRQG